MLKSVAELLSYSRHVVEVMLIVAYEEMKLYSFSYISGTEMNFCII